MRMPFGAGMLQTVDAADYISEASAQTGVGYAEETRTGIFVGEAHYISSEVVVPTIESEIV